MKRWLVAIAAAALVAASVAVLAQSPQPATVQVEPRGEPKPGGRLQDETFGVVSERFGLDRRVEMYQWRAGDNGFVQVWNAAPIDSSGFPPDYRNPPAIPLESQRWWSPGATLDGKPIDTTVLKALGEWRQFRPGFSRLPGNMAATFQPDGDGLSSSENPLDPQAGDLRVTWRELTLPPLAGKVELRDGRWQLAARASGTASAAQATATPQEVAAAKDPDDSTWSRPWKLLTLAALVVVALAIWQLRRRGRRRARE